MVPILLLLSSIPYSTQSTTGSTVRWYVASGRASDNVEFAKTSPKALTGFYGCCHDLLVSKNGSISTADNLSTTVSLHRHALDSLGRVLTYHSTFSVEAEAILSGVAKSIAPNLAKIAKDSGVDGLLCDYEPDFNYTVEHAQKYADFLSAVRKELNGLDLELGMDVAGWGILDKFDIYADVADFFTSMSPTYNAGNLTRNRDFVGEMTRTLGSDKVKVGLGSSPATGYEKNCANMPTYNYTESNLTPFLDYLKTNAQVSGVDIWKCDIDNYGKTADFFLDAIVQFKEESPGSPCSGHRCDTLACPCGCECGTDADPGLCYVPAHVSDECE